MDYKKVAKKLMYDTSSLNYCKTESEIVVLLKQVARDAYEDADNLAHKVIHENENLSLESGNIPNKGYERAIGAVQVSELISAKKEAL